jgi:type IV pilus assembly protein PilB
MAVKKIGELLVESGLITQEQLDEALKESRDSKGSRVGATLVKKGYATEIDIAQTLSFQLDIPFVDIAAATVDPEAVALVSEKTARKYHLMPLYREGKYLKVAMADPLNLNAMDDIRFSSGIEAAPSVATVSDVAAAIGRFYHLNEPMEELMVDLKKDKPVEIIHDIDSALDITDQVKKSYAPPIIKMVDSIIIHGSDARASDIHIEPQEKTLKLRIRVDGIMRETMQFPKWTQGPVTSRIKLMARMDITERRVSQDGRIKVRLGDKALDIRVSTLPTQYGETIVMRLLDPKGEKMALDNAGLAAADMDRAVDIIDRPQGVVLVTGPTGCGKTSMLYAMIGRIKSQEINIITIEDPIEYELKDVNQVAVNEKTGLTFSYTLRSVLRQDPDVILVGEMRDTETAIIAHQASMTGHLVFSTLHTNDAVSSVVRLKNLGVPHYMIASALNGIVGQRLVRKLCLACKEEYEPTSEELKRSCIRRTDKVRLFRGRGCKGCHDTGYSGRIGIFEVLTVNARIKELIAADATEHEIYNAAVEGGMTPMRIDGLKKVYSGVTSLEELSRVVYISKDEGPRAWVCPGCGGAVPPGEKMCPNCSTVPTGECPACGNSVQTGWIACPFCARRLADGKKAS